MCSGCAGNPEEDTVFICSVCDEECYAAQVDECHQCEQTICDSCMKAHADECMAGKDCLSNV